MYSVGYPKLGAGGGGGHMPFVPFPGSAFGGWTHFREFKGPDTYRSAGRREML